jgi:hypothetical protein
MQNLMFSRCSSEMWRRFVWNKYKIVSQVPAAYIVSVEKKKLWHMVCKMDGKYT